MSSFTEIIEKQSLVISIQAGVISDLFSLLSQYMTVEELSSLPQVASINDAEKLQAGIG